MFDVVLHDGIEAHIAAMRKLIPIVSRHVAATVRKNHGKEDSVAVRFALAELLPPSRVTRFELRLDPGFNVSQMDFRHQLEVSVELRPIPVWREHACRDIRVNVFRFAFVGFHPSPHLRHELRICCCRRARL